MSKHSSHNFDTIAFVYDSLASCIFGESIKQAQIDTIDFIPDHVNILIIGGGTGWYLKELLDRKKPKKLVYIEASQNMIYLTRKIIDGVFLTDKSIVELRAGTEDTILPDEQFDIIITHFFLDIFAPYRLQRIIGKLNQALSPEGIWLIADFSLPQRETGRYYFWKKILVKSMYMFFRIVCRISAKALPDFNHVFSQLGMIEVYRKNFYYTLIHSCVYSRK
jgi:ubiquinone/menaquinone biosynthesis C-methylase UbiE